MPVVNPGDDVAADTGEMSPQAVAMADDDGAEAGAGSAPDGQGAAGADSSGTAGDGTGVAPEATDPGTDGAAAAGSGEGAADDADDGSGGATGDDPDSAGGDPPAPADGAGDTFEGNFSFFVTSLEIMRELSGSQDGFGGDLGGLEGADSICQRAAATQGAGGKTWRAFLSTSTEDAIDRIGEGPWYDRNGRLVAENRSGLTSGDRPMGDSDVANNLPNERGEPLNQNGTDDHDVLTGSNREGRLVDASATCEDWTTTQTPAAGGGGGRGGRGNGPQLGHSWPARSGQSWVEAHRAPGCAPGVQLQQLGGGMGSDCVGCAGGYGGIYCFALEP